ncbi:PD-(D/E)XK nuclease family protein [Mesorhizobium sp. M0312]|uniref:PD-(D/E)XK nuclease family protein n=1 Tax=Mesorhizobium sp. M0312 TaxID=2956934 RepID=UPI0033350027
MPIHTVIVDGPLAVRMRRLDAARQGATGRQVLTVPLLASRLAGGFLAPASQEFLYPAIRLALEAGGFEDIGGVATLPGMPAAVLAALYDWWDAGVPKRLPNNARLRDFALLEGRVRAALPSGMLAPPDLVDAAARRLRLAPRLVGPVTIEDVPDIKPVWRPLVAQLSQVVPVRWISAAQSKRSWFTGMVESRSEGKAALASADLCADPRSEAREALRWARSRIADAGVAPEDIAIATASPWAWDDTFLVLAREAGLPLHFTHGVPALSTREGQACAALADIMLRGVSQERVRLLFGRLPALREQLPADWAKGLRRGAGLTTPESWRHAFSHARAERKDGDAVERVLLPILDLLAEGISVAKQAGTRLLRGRSLALWEDALRMAPPQAIELSLQALRVSDGREPGNSIVWGPARHLAAAPRKHVRLIGLDANSWPRRSLGEALLPDHVLEGLRLPSSDISDQDRMAHDILVGQSVEYTLSRADRGTAGARQGRSILWRPDLERIVGRSAIPRHAFSESDRLYARPPDAGKQPQIRSSRACWKAWSDGDRHTAHDGLVRPEHPLIAVALSDVQSTTSLRRMLCDPLGFVWEYALHWRQPSLDPQPLALDPRSFGELVHALIAGVLRDGAPRTADGIDIALTDEAKRLAAVWPISRAVPPGLLWRHTITLASERAARGLREALGESRGKTWTELVFGETVEGPHPWTTLEPVQIGDSGVRFRGRIDRLDEDVAMGAATITDYKAGEAPRRKRPLIFDRGRELQRVFYAMAVSYLLPDVRNLESRLVYLKNEPAVAFGLANDALATAIEQAISFTTAGAEVQHSGRIAPGPEPEFFDPLSIALPADAESYRRLKQRQFAQANSPLAKLWSSA